MKKLLIPFLLLLAVTSYAGQKAITDTGEEVILNSDGTWEYSDNSKRVDNVIKTNTTIFKKPANATFLVKSSVNNSAVWINPTKWTFIKAKNNPAAEFEFTLKGKDLYAMAIAEQVEISPDQLANIAFDNARAEAPDVKIVKQEYRVVNGKKIIYMEISGTMMSIKFTYLGYYYSDASGSTQLVAYTGTSLVDKYRAEINDFLNGLDKQ